MPNNYNQSSTGWNVDCYCCYDTDLSRFEYQENFKTVREDRRGDTRAVYYIGYGNVEGPDKVTLHVDGPREEKIRYLEKQDGAGYHDFTNWTDDDFDNTILNYQDITPFNLDENEQFFDGYELSFKTSKNILGVTSRGYSQGDSVTVFYSPDDIEKAWGKYPGQDELRKLFDHYLWDAPIQGHCAVNDEEFYYDEFVADRYEFEPEERTAWVKHIHEKTGCPIGILESVIPDEPVWN